MKTIARGFLALPFLWFLMGCSKTRSTAIATSEIYATYSVAGNSADQLTCSAVFQVGGGTGTYIEMDGEDTAICSNGTTEVTLNKTTDFLGIVEYSTTSLAYDAAKTYTLTFKRKAGETHAANATLPPAVVINSPAAASEQTKGAILNFTFTAATSSAIDATLSWSTSGKNGSTGHALTESGIGAFSATETKTLDSKGATVSGNISGTIKIERSLTGTFPSTLKGGIIRGRQQATRAITLVD